MLACANAASHTSHRNGFSPVCMRMCIFSLVSVNFIPQKSHASRRLLACISTCELRLLRRQNFIGHTSQRKGLSLVWLSMCTFSALRSANVNWQTSQVCDVSLVDVVSLSVVHLSDVIIPDTTLLSCFDNVSHITFSAFVPLHPLSAASLLKNKVSLSSCHSPGS